MSLKLINSLDGIFEIRDQWNRVAGNSPLSSWEWHASWFKHYGDDVMPFVVVDTDQDQQISAIASMYIRTTKFGSRVLRLSGDGNVCTDYNQLITKDGHQSFFASKLVKWLEEFTANNFDIDRVELDGIGNLNSTNQLIKSFVKLSKNHAISPLESCWILDLPKSWEELNSRFSKKHRRKTKKAVSRLKASDVQVLNEDNFESVWENFEFLHQCRRKMKGESGCFVDERFRGFLKDAVQMLSKRNMAQIIQISTDGKPFAATLMMHNNSSALMYQTGFDPAQASMEPGYMLIVAALQYSIENGLSSFDFMRGDEPYKARWNSEATPIYKAEFNFSRRLMPSFESQLRVSKEFLKRQLNLVRGGAFS